MADQESIDKPRDLLTKKGQKKVLNKLWQGLGGVVNGLARPLLRKIPIINKNEIALSATETVIGMWGSGVMKKGILKNVMSGYGTVAAARVAEKVVDVVLNKNPLIPSSAVKATPVAEATTVSDTSKISEIAGGDL